MDKQLAKDRKQSEKLGHTFIDFESKEEAAQQVGDAFDVVPQLISKLKDFKAQNS